MTPRPGARADLTRGHRWRGPGGALRCRPKSVGRDRMDFELVCEGLEFPEGPIAMNDGSVILTEIKGQRLTRVKPDGTREVVVNTGGGPNGAAVGPDNAIYITNNGGAFEWLDTNNLTI